MTNILDLNSVSSVLKDRDPKTPGPEHFEDPLDHLELQLEHAQAMADQPPDVFLKAAMSIAAVDFFTVLNRFDTDALIKRVHEKPELYFPFINSFANLMKVSLDQKKLEFKQKQAEAKQRDRDQKLRARKPILVTDTTLESFGRTLARSRRREEADPDSPAPPVAPASSIEHPPTNTTNTGSTDLLDASELLRAADMELPEAPPPSPLDESEPVWSDTPLEELVHAPSSVGKRAGSAIPY
jgi:hypothetical protein